MSQEYEALFIRYVTGEISQEEFLSQEAEIIGTL
jgi:hypothetical protein